MATGRSGGEWSATAEEVFTGMADWRAAHPRATLREIEAARDEHLAALRARMLEDLALRSAQTDVAALAPEERPLCPECGARLEARGRKRRRLTTTHERTITLTRTYAVCPVCGTGLFPPG
jgi:YgiT-type zinc finger domain-containing protein